MFKLSYEFQAWRCSGHNYCAQLFFPPFESLAGGSPAYFIFWSRKDTVPHRNSVFSAKGEDGAIAITTFVVANLSKPGADLSHRAHLNSEDEFSELARDLNSFLDRLCYILKDLEHVLQKVATLNTRLSQINSQIQTKYETTKKSSQDISVQMFRANARVPLLSNEWKTSMELTLSALQTKLSSSPIPQEIEGKMSEVWQQFDDAVSQFESMQQDYIQAGQGLTQITGEMQDFSHHISEMGILKEKMQNIAEMGQNLIHRLTGKKDSE